MALVQKLCVCQAGATAELDPMCLLSSCAWMRHRMTCKAVKLMQHALSHMFTLIRVISQL